VKARFFIAMTLACLSSGAALAQDAPLYEAFQKFCVATNTDYAQVKAAVTAAGAQPSASDATNQPTQVATSDWTIAIRGQQLSISAATLRTPATAKTPEGRSSDCTVTGFAQDDASADLIRKWIGIPPSRTSQGGLNIYFYDYQQSANQRLMLPTKDTDIRALEKKGIVWHLVLLQSKTGGSVQLSHTMGAGQ